MADDLFERADRLRSRIDAGDAEDVQYWSHKLGVNSQELKEAVAMVGNEADKVTEFLLRRAVGG